MSDDANRVQWVDVFKFFGIWAIYIGHFGVAAGKLYPFVFIYHVPLFFFAAGFFSPSLNDEVWSFLKKKTLQLMLPYAVFSIIALIVYALAGNEDWPSVHTAMTFFLTGVRNQGQVGTLWFIPCLYLIVIFNFLVFKTFKTKIACLCFSILTFIASQFLLGFNPLVKPSWVFNLDSALYYYFWYASGSLIFPLLLRSEKLSSYGKVEWLLTGLAFLVAGNCYFFGPAWISYQSQTYPDGSLSAMSFVISITTILALVYLNVFFAKLFSNVEIFSRLGKETLILCGTEVILKLMLSQILILIGLKLTLSSPLSVAIFSLICLAVSLYTVIYFLNLHFPKLIGKGWFSASRVSTQDSRGAVKISE